MAATITVEKKDERSKLQKAKDFAVKYRYAILGGTAAGVLYFLGFRSGWNACDEHIGAVLKKVLPDFVDKCGSKGAFAFYDWMAERVPEALKLCDEFSDKHPDLSDVREYFMKDAAVTKLIETCRN